MELDSITALSRGATFFRGDLHVHSFGGSHDVVDASATPANIIEAAKAEKLSIIAITDHNEIANVRAAIDLGKAKSILVVPGVELSTGEGHLLCCAPTADALERFFNRLTIADRRTMDCRCQTGTVECLNLLQAEGGFGILAHVDLQNAFEYLLPRPTPAKRDILCHAALVGIEVSRADCPIYYSDKDADNDRKNIISDRIARLKLGSQQFLARILNSDAHTLVAVGRNAKNDHRITRYKMEAPTFDGLRMALEAADTRVRIEDEVPAAVPFIQGIHFSGGFLDSQAIHFSPNLTCLIGGRGSGKSTAFEGLRLLGDYGGEDEITVIDSDVWPDLVTLIYCDETAQRHALGRSRNSAVENIDDPLTGPTTFPLESYRQGETNDISKRVQDDPLALLTFLDRLTSVEDAIAAEDDLRQQLNELTPKIEKARVNVEKIPGFQKDLKLKTDQIERLKKDKGEEIIKLQQKVESEKRSRTAVETALTGLTAAVSKEAITTITAGILDNVAEGAVELGAPEAALIRTKTTTFDAGVDESTAALKQVTSAYVADIRAQTSAWKTKQTQSADKIEEKKKELLAHGIRLDMPFIQKLVSDQARAEENVKNLKTWIPELDRLRKDYVFSPTESWCIIS